jgi:hypothetical protein
VFILKEVKVFCFDTLLQVLILKDLQVNIILAKFAGIERFLGVEMLENALGRTDKKLPKNKKAAARLPRSKNTFEQKQQYSESDLWSSRKIS